jgi:putative transposase
VTDVINDEKAAVDLDAARPQLGGASDELVRQLAERARAEGLRLTGEGGLLSQLTKVVVESALDGELDDHLGYGRHDPAGTAAIPATASAAKPS